MTSPVQTPSGRPPRWLGIQYLRGIAACGVVVFHYFDGPMAPAGYDFGLGRYGVDLFFVISGFIMFTVAREERVGQFLERRLSRIYPLYWVATAAAMLAYWLYDHIHPSGTELLKSLALWPHYSEAHPQEIWPVLVPGWSLSYELYFYGLFALGLALRRPALVPATLIVVAIGLGWLIQPQAAPFKVATNLLLLEFVAGLFLAWAAARASRHLGAITACAVAIGLILAAAGQPRLALGAGAAAVVALTVVIEARGTLPQLALPRLLGDASYSIYLFHSPILFVIERTAHPPQTGVAAVGSALLINAGAVALCIVLHFALERPLLRATLRASRFAGQLVAQLRQRPSSLPPGATPG